MIAQESIAEVQQEQEEFTSTFADGYNNNNDDDKYHHHQVGLESASSSSSSHNLPDPYNNNNGGGDNGGNETEFAFVDSTERQSRIERLEERFQDVENKVRQSCCARFCCGLWHFLQFLNTVILWLLVAIVIYEFTRISKLESELSSERDQLDALQEVVKEKQEYQIKKLNSEVQKEQTFTNYMLSGTFTLLACLVSMFHMSSHLSKMNQPMIQRKILSILWMSPIYSVTSFLSLLYPPLEGSMKIIKDFYESFCIYQFLSFMILVLGRGTREQAVVNLAKYANHLKSPSRALRKFYNPPPETSDQAKANAVITECQIMALQFVFIRPLTSILYVVFVLGTKEVSSSSSSSDGGDIASATRNNVTRLLVKNIAKSLKTDFENEFSSNNNFTESGGGGDDNNNFEMWPTMSPTFSSTNSTAGLISQGAENDLVEATKGFFTSFSFVLYMAVNISVFFAFLGLLRFYHAVRDEILWIRPWPKFLTIKGVVFLTFWQGLMILIIVNLNSKSNNNNNHEDPSQTAHRYQNMLICLEMLLFSVTHWCVFPAEEWQSDYQPSRQMNAPGIGIQDFVSDVSHIVKNRNRRRKSRRRRGRPGQSPQYYKATAAFEGDGSHFQEEEEEEQVELPRGNRTGVALNARRMYDYDDGFNNEDILRRRTFSDGSKADDEDEFDSDNENELI